jgi:hypothetical protein
MGQENQSNLHIADAKGNSTIHLQGEGANLHVGGKGPNADVTLRDADGKTSIKNIQ